jgi:hypothetical protein
MFFDQNGTILGYADTEASEFANLWLPDGSSRAIPVAEAQGPPSVNGIANGWVVGYDTTPLLRRASASPMSFPPRGCLPLR